MCPKMMHPCPYNLIIFDPEDDFLNHGMERHFLLKFITSTMINLYMGCASQESSVEITCNLCIWNILGDKWRFPE